MICPENISVKEQKYDFGSSVASGSMVHVPEIESRRR